jgi:hypothetical protein
MIELKSDSLIFSFPEVHPKARLRIDFQRTLRIPNDGGDYPLPSGLGRFPLRHVDDHASMVPERWIEHGGVMMPMYQAEAMWISFRSDTIEERDAEYPFAVRIATGKIDAVTGEAWTDGLHGLPQDYLVIPEQPWLDGYCVGKGRIRQFVAMALGAGHTAEEQITGKAEYGGLQVIAFPMKAEAFYRRFPLTTEEMERRILFNRNAVGDEPRFPSLPAPGMGLAPGGRMRQEVFEDPFDFDDWDRDHSSRCFVHITGAPLWQAITGEVPPTEPPTREEYARAGLPWFDYYAADAKPLEGSKVLEELRSVIRSARRRRDRDGTEVPPVYPERVVKIRRGRRRNQVREGRF